MKGIIIGSKLVSNVPSQIASLPISQTVARINLCIHANKFMIEHGHIYCSKSDTIFFCFFSQMKLLDALSYKWLVRMGENEQAHDPPNTIFQ